MLVSGTHGVEGFAGSALQTGLLREDVLQKLRPQTGLLMIHALNPYGFAHIRRVNEDNIDLNRNFLDHAMPHPANEGYRELATAMAPTRLSFWHNAMALLRVQWYRLWNGTPALRQALSGGQYTHPQGLFFGGLRATWSNTTIRTIAREHLSEAQRIAFIEIHTGLGHYACMEPIMNAREESPEVGRAREWLGESVRTTDSGEASSAPLYGTLKLAVPGMLPPRTEVTAITLEFGTLSRREVLWALRSENWLFHHGGLDYPEADGIKHALLRAFYPDDDNWKHSVWKKGKATIYKVLDQF